METADLKGSPPQVIDQARRLLLAYLSTAEAGSLPFSKLARALANGKVTAQMGMIAHEEVLKSPPDAYRDAACASGCAFCCILSGEDGGTITGAEAARMHAALAPLAGQPDGRDWHAFACPSLDPVTRTCRAYDARPMICRSFFSTDAAACEENANGGEADGAAVLSSHLIYLAMHGLIRVALAGVIKVPSYSLARLAAGAVSGQSLEHSLTAARHPPRMLDDARKGSGVALARARRR